MIVAAPINPNAINVPLIQTGCLKSEFDSTYPIHLNGIITRDEFQQSIHNINQAVPSRKALVICGLIFIVCIIGGMILFIGGGLTAGRYRTYGFPVLIIIGFGLFVLGMFFLSCGCYFVQSRRISRIRHAVANESMKYSTRSPTPCSWRLDVSRVWYGGYGFGYRQRTRFLYRLVIEIGHSALPGSGNVPYQFNQTAPQTLPFFPQQIELPPPPYYDQSAAGFCSQCGIPRENITAKFCSSCGHPFYM